MARLVEAAGGQTVKAMGDSADSAFMPRALAGVLVLVAIAAQAAEPRPRLVLFEGARAIGPALVAARLQGTRIVCYAIDSRTTKLATGLKRVHATACFEYSTGEGILAVLRRNGTIACGGAGQVDPLQPSCASMNVCGTIQRFCLTG